MSPEKDFRKGKLDSSLVNPSRQSMGFVIESLITITKYFFICLKTFFIWLRKNRSQNWDKIEIEKECVAAIASATPRLAKFCFS